ncbi:MAG: electron transport complex subunit RsxA [Candidatus Schekmanbacteria bacterium]|nr:electron transport complex subunit RsxA [Candidatus Schekmanbacteria bacterium]
MLDYVLMVIGAILVNNILLARFLGNCPFIGCSQQIESAIGMGLAVIFVLTLAGALTWLVNAYILLPLGIGYLQTIAFILVIAALVQFVEMVIQKTSPGLYQALGIYLPLITTNCCVLGVALINVNEGYNFLQALIFSASSAAGFAFALFIFAGMRERLAFSAVPKPFQGIPIALITAGLLSLAFFGFAGMIK